MGGAGSGTGLVVWDIACTLRGTTPRAQESTSGVDGSVKQTAPVTINL